MLYNAYLLLDGLIRVSHHVLHRLAMMAYKQCHRQARSRLLEKSQQSHNTLLLIALPTDKTHTVFLMHLMEAKG